MIYQIELTDCQNHVDLDESFVSEVVEATLSAECVAEAAIGVAIVDDAEIHDLNRRYLNHDYETDVLSFLLESEQITENHSLNGSEPRRGAGMRIEGEVAVSAETAVNRAAEFGWSARDELVLYLVHGLLHLCGYDDQCAKEKRAMQARERSVLALWDLTPRYAEPNETNSPERLPAADSSQDYPE